MNILFITVLNKKFNVLLKTISKMRGANIIPMTDEGIRFVNHGYKIPRPLIPIDGVPLFVRAAICLPDTDLWIFICKCFSLVISKQKVNRKKPEMYGWTKLDRFGKFLNIS